jgi:UDP-N-acetylmuramoylalanine--D-glutamate ligase
MEMLRLDRYMDFVQGRDRIKKKVLILGAARQGLALARYLALHDCDVTINDRQSAEVLREAQEQLSGLDVKWVLGGHPVEILDGKDMVCVSGGVPLTLPLIQEAQRRGMLITNDSQIFLELTPAKVIGITGSAGKTTTTSLVSRIAQMAVEQYAEEVPYRRVWVGGNIGNPLIGDVDEMTRDDLVVLELSSFQLDLMTKSPQVAVVLNITPNHLDRHGTMESYIAAKAHILTHQRASDIAILNREDSGSWGLKGDVQGKLATFGLSFSKEHTGTFFDDETLYYWDGCATEAILQKKDIQLRGEHNLQNVSAACMTVIAAGLPLSACRDGVMGFSGVAHRLEFVRQWDGASWYNDSIATAPERSMAAIRSFTEPLVLLAGGRDKNLPWMDFARLAISRVRYFILFGEAADKIERSLLDAGGDKDLPIIRCAGLQEAVQKAAAIVQPGDVVLLSPGGTSFDEFRDFEERGECFRKWVMDL